MTYTAAKAKAREIDRLLRADDPRFAGEVHMIHEEGTEFKLKYSFAEDLDEQYVAIYTEHHGFFVYDKEDLTVLHRITKEAPK